jgi:NAD(P)-dependent dehydrogenase (short-subunit alcohol dehydrogenase family)
MMTDLSGRTALVTGSTSGIGRAIAERLAADGATVVLSGRDAERGAEAVAKIEAAGGRAVFVAADLSDPSGADRLAAAAIAAVGPIDILVNNAGIFPSAPTLDVDAATFDAVFAVNVRAPFRLVQALVPGMLDRGGVVVNLGSWVSNVGLGLGSLYASSKATLESLTKGWAAEFGPRGVRVNAVAPGVTLTEGTSAGEEYLRPMVERFPAGRFATPADIAAAVSYLVGDEASYVHGTTLVVDGGALATRT